MEAFVAASSRHPGTWGQDLLTEPPPLVCMIRVCWSVSRRPRLALARSVPEVGHQPRKASACIVYGSYCFHRV
jgi:hypothetical protein